MTDDELLSAKQRSRLLGRLHRQLFWCGEKIPEEVDIRGNMVPLHELIWELVNKRHLDEKDKEHVDRCIDLLLEKAGEYESHLENDQMTVDQARDFFDKTAGLLRAVMDLKEIEEHPDRDRGMKFHEQSRICKLKDAKDWLQFISEIED